MKNVQRFPTVLLRLTRRCALLLALLGSASPVWAAADMDVKAAQEAMQRGEFRVAITEIDKLLAEATLSAEARLNLLFNRAQANMALHEFDAAIADLERVIKIDPSAADAWSNIGTIHEQRRNYREALNYHRNALAQALAISTPTPLSILAHNNLAWLLATCPIEDCRDGAAAVENSHRSLELLKTNFPSADAELVAGHFDTLAAGYAEIGDFTRAMEAQEQALSMLKGQPSEQNKAYAERLESYRAKKPWRLPAP